MLQWLADFIEPYLNLTNEFLIMRITVFITFILFFSHGNTQSWIQKGLDIDGEAALDLSGFSVSSSADGNTVAIAALLNDGNGTDAGHVRVYNWNKQKR